MFLPKYKKALQKIRKNVLEEREFPVVEEEELSYPDIQEPERKKTRYEKTVISQGIDVLETDAKKVKQLKSGGFLLTLNTNKNRATLNTNLLSETNEEGDYGYEDFCRDVEAYVLQELRKKEYYVPKMYRATIDSQLHEDIRDFISKIVVEPGAWEESSEGNGRKIHIHITIRVMYSGQFIGFFHINCKLLAFNLKQKFDDIAWNPYLQCRFISESSMTVAKYIHKLHHEKNISLYEHTAKKIAEYKLIRQRKEQELMENIKEQLE